MPLPPAGEKIEFGKSNNFLLTWSPQMGEICRADIGLRLDRPPPPVRWQAAVAEVAKPEKKPAQAPSKQDKYLNALYGVMGAVEAATRTKEDFQRWLQSPPSASSSSSTKGKQPPEKKVPPFDLQDIPGAMRKIGAPVGAALMERWFAGALNYAPTSEKKSELINQDGMPFPPAMFDTTTIKMDWVMKFRRARKGLETLQSMLETPNARNTITKMLYPYRHRRNIDPWLECRADILKYHKKFQFQMVSVEGTLNQKMMQFATQFALNKGVPDDLTCALGAFNIYAAISNASFDAAGRSAVITHISVYVKDNFTFTDIKVGSSQYLGHWNRRHVATLPSHEIARRFNVDWLDHAVVQGNVFDQDAVLYPVKNSDFRDWQRRHSQGGDFIIFSNLISISLERPIKVYFQ